MYNIMDSLEGPGQGVGEAARVWESQAPEQYPEPIPHSSMFLNSEGKISTSREECNVLHLGQKSKTNFLSLFTCFIRKGIVIYVCNNNT